MTGKSKRTMPRTASTRERPAGPTAAQKRLAAKEALAAASRARAARRRRVLTVLSPIAVVLLVLVVFVAVKAASGSHHPKSGVKARAADTSVAGEVTGVPATTLNTVGKGSIEQAPTALSGAALTDGGKPQVLFIGAEWCPYCAAERWPLTVALSRFGKLTGLGQVRSSPSDVDPNTATLTFHGASYTSDYLSLTAKEIYSNQAVGNAYAKLDTLTADEQNLFLSVGKARSRSSTSAASTCSRPPTTPPRSRAWTRPRSPRPCRTRTPRSPRPSTGPPT